MTSQHADRDGRDQPSGPGSLLHEPLLHFILIGGLLFLLSMLLPKQQDDAAFRIEVSRERIAVLYHGFLRDYQREPTSEELQELIDDYIRTELCVREARALGLQEGDQLIRDHLRSKYEMMLDDGSDPPEPTEQDLQQFLAGHPERYRTEPAIALRQIYLDPLQREEAQLDAELLLGQLSGDEEVELVRELSDPGSLPPHLPLVALSEVGWQFDPLFAEAVGRLPVGEWGGPVLSSYGVHLVYVEERETGRLLELNEIRSDVELDWIAAQLEKRLDAELDEVRSQYSIEVDDYDLAELASEDKAAAEGDEEEAAVEAGP